MPPENQPDPSQNGRDAEPPKWSDEWVRQRAAEVEAKVAAMPPVAEWTAEEKQRGGLWLLKVIQEHFGDIPPEEWDDVPTDYSEQTQHYLYGTPRKPRPKRFASE